VFRSEPTISHLPVVKEQVVAIIESINQPQISVPGKLSQTVTGHLVGVRNPNGSFSIYVGLHLAKSGENVVYVNERAQLTVEEYRTVEVEGLHFLESMGFMLDNLNFRNLATAAQDQTFQRIPLFHPPRPPAPAPAPAAPAPAPAAAATPAPVPGAAPTPAPQPAQPPQPPIDLGRLARFLSSV
jgi:hypothetical protein